MCGACLAEVEVKESAEKQEPPPRIERDRGRRPSVDTSRHFCCEKECEYHGRLNRGNIIANGHPSGGRWRQLKCVVCGKHFQETIGTVFYGSSVPAENITHGIAQLCEGTSPRRVARVYRVDKDTVLSWLTDAAVHSEAAIDPISKLILALEVGDRSLEMAQRLVHGVASVLAPGVVPLSVTDRRFRVPPWRQERMAT